MSDRDLSGQGPIYRELRPAKRDSRSAELVGDTPPTSISTESPIKLTA